MTSVGTATDTAPPADEAPVPPSRPRARVWPWITAFAVAASFVGAYSVQIPYYAIAPGNALAVAPLVRVTDGPSYRAKGGVYLCTVSLGRTSVLEALAGWLDPTVDVVKQDLIVPPDVGAKKLRDFNLKLMDTSKEQAVGVAFEQLGYDAITGDGAQVVQVLKGSPADGALAPGDVITAVDDNHVRLHNEAVRAIGTRKAGDRVALTVAPAGGGAPKRVELVLAENPDRPGRGRLGVTLRTATPHFDFPYKVDIASDRIGGPSAGLAFTLEVLDVLTKGELTGGTKVAATGTIELDGSVGEIGGVAQKTVAVREAGVHLFLVPMSEVAEARRHAGKHLRIEGVRNIRDALRILAGVGGNGLALGQPGRVGA
jgi:PDZ domain-containing protein